MNLSEEEYIQSALIKMRKDEKEVSINTMNFIEDGIKCYPDSPKLLCIKGDAIQWGPDDGKYELSDALESYERALQISPNFGEAYESIGYYYDAIDENLPKAEEAFRKAIELKSGVNSYVGLARVMSQQGTSRNDVIVFLTSSGFQETEEVEEIIEEIEDGLWDS